MSNDDKPHGTVIREVTRGGTSAIMPYVAVGVVGYFVYKKLSDMNIIPELSAGGIVERVNEIVTNTTTTLKETVSNVIDYPTTLFDQPTTDKDSTVTASKYGVSPTATGKTSAVGNMTTAAIFPLASKAKVQTVGASSPYGSNTQFFDVMTSKELSKAASIKAASDKYSGKNGNDVNAPFAQTAAANTLKLKALTASDAKITSANGTKSTKTATAPTVQKVVRRVI